MFYLDLDQWLFYLIFVLFSRAFLCCIDKVDNCFKYTSYFTSLPTTVLENPSLTLGLSQWKEESQNQ